MDPSPQPTDTIPAPHPEGGEKHIPPPLGVKFGAPFVPPPPIGVDPRQAAFAAVQNTSRGIYMNKESALGQQRSPVEDVIQRFEVDPDFAADLPILSNFHLAFIIDDSGSMGMRTSAGETRWQELQRTFGDFLEIASSFAAGADADLLNVGPPHLDITVDQLRGVFNNSKPYGRTPLVGKIRSVLARAMERYARTQQRTCIVVGTDGTPTDGSVNDILSLLNNPSTRNPEVVPIMFLACTDDEGSVDYLNVIDQRAKCVDVCDDFKSERIEVAAASGRVLSYGDYMIKCLLGAVLPKYDSMDEGPMHVCVACGFDGTLEPIPGTYTKHGWKCRSCTGAKATRAPPYCTCAKCHKREPSMVYTRKGTKWLCSDCHKPSGCSSQ